MKFRYSKYTGTLLDEIDLEDLVSKLSDLLLTSGFSNPWSNPLDSDEDRTMQALHDAILEALFSGGVLSEEALQRLLGEPADGDQEAARQQLEDLIQQIIERMMEQGFLTGAPDLDGEREHRQGSGGGSGEDAGQVRFEVTDKALDFLGYRALRDLLGSIGRSSAGRHDTRHLSTGIETVAAPKPYEFGDTLNIDPSGTILNAVQRLHHEGRLDQGLGAASIDIDYSDLMVAQSEYQSSCATVIMLDCSHSMILYGEDRFTPAKRVALALAHLIRTQYPGDSLHAVLFHDSAEEIPLKQLGRVRVGPYYTNTR
jgi:Ca-activated chloride channel family protein